MSREPGHRGDAPSQAHARVRVTWERVHATCHVSSEQTDTDTQYQTLCVWRLSAALQCLSCYDCSATAAVCVHCSEPGAAGDCMGRATQL